MSGKENILFGPYEQLHIRNRFILSCFHMSAKILCVGIVIPGHKKDVELGLQAGCSLYLELYELTFDEMWEVMEAAQHRNVMKELKLSHPPAFATTLQCAASSDESGNPCAQRHSVAVAACKKERTFLAYCSMGGKMVRVPIYKGATYFRPVLRGGIATRIVDVPDYRDFDLMQEKFTILLFFCSQKSPKNEGCHRFL